MTILNHPTKASTHLLETVRRGESKQPLHPLHDGLVGAVQVADGAAETVCVLVAIGGKA